MIVFQTNQDSKVLVIGGVSSVNRATGDTGLSGPMPRYSISREIISTGDGTYVNSKFTINVTGTATIDSAQPNQDITEKGQRQSTIQGDLIKTMQFIRNIFPNQGTGKLEIQPYNGLDNIIIYKDARLLSVDLPEQQENSAGVQNFEYNFVFEAYQEESVGTNIDTLAKADPTYLLESVSENWDLNENDGIFFQGGVYDSAENVMHKTYSLSHTVTAKGLKKYSLDNANELEEDGEAFRQAVQWVSTRLVNDPTVAITEDLMGDTTFFQSTFLPIEMNKPEVSDELGFTLSGDGGEGLIVYDAFNHVRVVKSDQSAGSYEVTDTWILSQENFYANHVIEATYEAQQDQPFTSVNINATINGLDYNTSSITSISKYDNAKRAFDLMRPTLITLAEEVYRTGGGAGTLSTQVVNESVGANKTGGVITYSATYNDREAAVEGSISESVNVSYSNQYGIVDIYAVIQVLGKQDGPVIQNFETTPIFNTNITVDLTMARGFGKPNGQTLSEPYRPTADNAQCKSFTESWNPSTRVYNLSESWDAMPLTTQ